MLFLITMQINRLIFFGHSPGLNSQAKPGQLGGGGHVWAGLIMGAEGKLSFLGLGRREKSCLRSVTLMEQFPQCGQPWREEEPAEFLTSILGTGCNFSCL